jgi:hypothetical protein
MGTIIEKLLVFFSEFTWRRFFALLVVAALLFMAFSLFERYTSSFRLGRLQKSAELISKIQAIETTITNSSLELQRDYRALIAQATEAVEVKPISLDVLPSTLRFSMDDVWKFLAGGVLWFIFALFTIPKSLRGDKESRRAFGGMMLFAAISGFVGIFVHPYRWPWFHLFLFPFILMGAVFLMLVPVIYFVTKRASKKPAEKETQ